MKHLNHQTGAWVLFFVMGFLMVSSCLYLAYEAQESETRSFLYENPWAWLGPEISWATPSHKDPNDRDITSAWQFDLDYPVGYTERVIVPEHSEICVYTQGNQSICTKDK